VRTVDVLVGLGWLAFWLYWLSAAAGVKSGRSRWHRYIGFRIVIALVVVTLLRIPAFRGHDTRDAVLGAIGVPLFVLGLALAVWARIYLGRNWGSPMSEKHDPELITTGPYRWIRNPIYSGIILAMVGTAIAISLQWLVIAVLLGGFFVYSAVMEQRFLESRFPETYPPYKQSTKLLIPFVL
jgi:protein-S-isoprenylcysteine O-methyltransferase Ste14